MGTDLLLITGPMNAAQLGVPADANYHVVQVHPSGPDIGSTAYRNAMRDWLGGRTLRDRLRMIVPDLGHVGVAWFSAGHGAVKAILSGASHPSSAVAWLCLDGLYGSNEFAVHLAQASMVNETSLMATASTSTPGHYDHSLDRWRDVVAKAQVPPAPLAAATQWGLPEPDEIWGYGGCLVAGYEHLGHHQQVPAVRSAMLRWWDSARSYEEPPSPLPKTPTRSDESSGAVWVGTAAVAFVAGAAAYWIWRRT